MDVGTDVVHRPIKKIIIGGALEFNNILNHQESSDSDSHGNQGD